jgi:hypothetical protein
MAEHFLPSQYTCLKGFFRKNVHCFYHNLEVEMHLKGVYNPKEGNGDKRVTSQ